MGLKAAILDRDNIYIERLRDWMHTKGKACEICSYNSLEEALEALQKDNVSLLMAAECMQIVPEDVTAAVAFGYITGAESDSLNGCPAVYKYQKGNDIFAQFEKIVSDYEAEKQRRIADRAKNFKVFAVASASGGAGAQVTAASLVKNLSMSGKEALLVNLKLCGSVKGCFAGMSAGDAAALFAAEPGDDIKDVLKGKTCFDYSAAPLSRLGLSGGMVSEFISRVRESCLFDAVVFVMDFDFNKESLAVFEEASFIIAVVEESRYSIDKFDMKIRLLKDMEKEGQIELKGCIAAVFNKFNNQAGINLQDGPYKILGGLPLLLDTEQSQMVERFANMAVFNSLS